MEKNTIKEYFRNGSRPTQEHFYALIDSCFNEDQSIYLSGYEVKAGRGDHALLLSMDRGAGVSTLIPWFKRINIPHERIYNYSVSCSNLDSELILEKITLELQLPQNKTYEVKDGNALVKISQSIALETIAFYNGSEVLELFDTKNIPVDRFKEFLIRKNIGKWEGINIDITVAYDIKSNIAISDQFDLTKDHARELEHVFGGVACKFIKETL